MPTPSCSRWPASMRLARRSGVPTGCGAPSGSLMTRRGADLRYGRTLPRALRAAGLVDVAAAGSFPIGGTVCDRLEIATIRHVRAELVAARLTDDAELDAHLAAVAAGELDLTLAPLIS